MSVKIKPLIARGMMRTLPGFRALRKVELAPHLAAERQQLNQEVVQPQLLEIFKQIYRGDLASEEGLRNWLVKEHSGVNLVIAPQAVLEQAGCSAGFMPYHPLMSSEKILAAAEAVGNKSLRGLTTAIQQRRTEATPELANYGFNISQPNLFIPYEFFHGSPMVRLGLKPLLFHELGHLLQFQKEYRFPLHLRGLTSLEGEALETEFEKRDRAISEFRAYLMAKMRNPFSRAKMPEIVKEYPEWFKEIAVIEYENFVNRLNALLPRISKKAPMGLLMFVGDARYIALHLPLFKLSSEKIGLESLRGS